MGKRCTLISLSKKSAVALFFLKGIRQRNGFSIYGDTFAPGKWMKHMVYLKVFWHSSKIIYSGGLVDASRETREGCPLLTVEIE
jgi:hypothetical protein